MKKKKLKKKRRKKEKTFTSLAYQVRSKEEKKKLFILSFLLSDLVSSLSLSRLSLITLEGVSREVRGTIQLHHAFRTDETVNDVGVGTFELRLLLVEGHRA